MNPDDASRTPPETRSIAAAVLVVFGVAVFLYGGWLFYGEVTMTPYTYVAEEVDASDVDERSLSVVEFHELSEDERAAFLEMVEREGPGDGYHSGSDEPPIEADAVRYEGEVYDVYLGQIREVGGLMLYVFAVFTLIGAVIAASGARVT